MKMANPLTAIAVALIMVLAGGNAIAEEQIKIGGLFDLSGPASFFGKPSRLVATMAVDHINKEGGINGKPVTLLIADTKGRPSRAAQIARAFISKEKVIALIGPTRTSSGLAIKQIVREARVPTYMTVDGDPVISDDPRMDYSNWVFKAPPPASVAIRRIYLYMNKKGFTRIAIMTAANGYGKHGARWLKKLAPDYDLKIVAAETFSHEATNLVPQLTRAKNARPDALVVWTMSRAGLTVIADKARMGIDLPLFQCQDLTDPRYIRLAGRAAEGDRLPATKLMVADELSDTDPQKALIREFINLYRRYGYDKRFPINTHTAYAWDAVMILANALSKSGTKTVDLRTALEKTRGFVGISGIYNLSSRDHNGLDVGSMVMVQVKNGKFAIAK